MSDFLPRSVVERDDEMKPGIALGQFFGFVQERADVRLQSVALADHPYPDAVAMQRRQIVADEAPEQAEQVADFGRWPRPVFRAEGENRQVQNAELAGGADHTPERLDATAMAFRPRQAAGRRPAPVPVH